MYCIAGEFGEMLINFTRYPSNAVKSCSKTLTNLTEEDFHMALIAM